MEGSGSAGGRRPDHGLRSRDQAHVSCASHIDSTLSPYNVATNFRPSESSALSLSQRAPIPASARSRDSGQVSRVNPALRKRWASPRRTANPNLPPVSSVFARQTTGSSRSDDHTSSGIAASRAARMRKTAIAPGKGRRASLEGGRRGTGRVSGNGSRRRNSGIPTPWPTDQPRRGRNEARRPTYRIWPCTPIYGIVSTANRRGRRRP